MVATSSAEALEVSDVDVPVSEVENTASIGCGGLETPKHRGVSSGLVGRPLLRRPLAFVNRLRFPKLIRVRNFVAGIFWRNDVKLGAEAIAEQT